MSTYGAQLDEPIEIVRYYADLLGGYPMTEDLGEIEAYGGRHHRWVEKEAAGVVAAIIGYNYPNQLALAKLAPALAAGCTVVLKAAPDTPLITLALGELIAEHTDIPPGVVNVLTSSQVEVGRGAHHHAGRRHDHVHRFHRHRPPHHGAPPAARSSGCSSSSAASPRWSCSTTPTLGLASMVAAFSDLLTCGAGLRDHHPDARAARAGTTRSPSRSRT